MRHNNSREYEVTQMTEPSADVQEGSKRPPAITIICVVGFIGALLSIPMFFSPVGPSIGTWYLPYLFFSVVLQVVCMIGLWQMRKWAVYTYTTFMVLNQLVLYNFGIWNIEGMLLPVVVVFFLFRHVAKMT